MYLHVMKLVIVMFLAANMALPQVVTAQENRPYSLEELEKLIKPGSISDERIIEVVYENGLDFYPDELAIARLKRAGASDKVIEVVRMAEHPPGPQSQAVEKKGEPFYKKGWFLVFIAILVGGAVAYVATGS
jgi:hypothetical protein